MKRYILFMVNRYYPVGALGDAHSCYDEVPSKHEVLDVVKSKDFKRNEGVALVFDANEFKYVLAYEYDYSPKSFDEIDASDYNHHFDFINKQTKSRGE